MRKIIHTELIIGQRVFFRRIFSTLFQPVFITLAVAGQVIIVLGATGFYFVERGENPAVTKFLDAYWWAVATATTVGYGDIIPATTPGRCVGILMMLLGGTLFCSFTALFATTLLAGQLEEVEAEMKQLEKRIKDETLK